jgi:hypothetical protein
MTRQQLARPLIAVSAAAAFAILVGCARHARNPPAPEPEGEAQATPTPPAPRKPVPRDEVAFKPPVDTPEGKPAPEPPTRTPEDKPVTPDKPVTLPDSRDKEPAPPAQKLEDVLQYVGAFRVPYGKSEDSTFNFGGTALAFNPANKSLFLVGHDWSQAVGEVKIPDSFVNSARPEDLPTAKILQEPTKVLPRVPNMTLRPEVKIGGLMVVDGRLIGSAYEYYDADCKAVESHFRLDSLDLSSAKGEGLFRVGTLGGGFVGGYMAPVSPEWQKLLGARYVTGQAALCIISRTSSGPAAFGFDPKDLGRDAAPVTPLVYYPEKHPLGPMLGRDANFNGTTSITGVLFVPGSRTVLFFGSHGTGEIGYGEAADFNDPARTAKSYHSRGGKYEYQVWAYDVLDLVAVKEQKKQPWEVKPYAVWHLRFPIDEPAKVIGGVAFDPQTARLYVSQLRGEHREFINLPLIHVFKVSVKGK